MIIKELITQLDMPDTEYWYDSASTLARDIIDEQTDCIFDLLLASWKTWPMKRQEHLAYVLGESKLSKELELINELLTSEHEEVVYRAREALIDFRNQT